MYEAPIITVLGPVGELTQAQEVGGFTDELFPTNTAFEDLTFSN